MSKQFFAKISLLAKGVSMAARSNWYLVFLFIIAFFIPLLYTTKPLSYLTCRKHNLPSTPLGAISPNQGGTQAHYAATPPTITQIPLDLLS